MLYQVHLAMSGSRTIKFSGDTVIVSDCSYHPYRGVCNFIWSTWTNRIQMANTYIHSSVEYTFWVFIWVSVPRQESERWCISVRAIDFALFYNFDLRFWSCSDNVVFWSCSDSVVFWSCSDSVVCWSCSDRVVFWSCSDRVVFWSCSDSVVFWSCSDSVVFWSCTDSVVIWSCSDSVVFFVLHLIIYPLTTRIQQLTNRIQLSNNYPLTSRMWILSIYAFHLIEWQKENKSQTITHSPVVCKFKVLIINSLPWYTHWRTEGNVKHTTRIPVSGILHVPTASVV